MKLTLERHGSCGLPDGCYVSLQVGQSQQLQKFDQSCHFDFPNAQPEEHTAKVEIFQRIGVCDMSLTSAGTARSTCNAEDRHPSLQGLQLRLHAEKDGTLQSAQSPSKVFGWCSGEAQRQVDTPAVVACQEVQIEHPAPLEDRRLLVLTDVGEEIDDEAALWLLSQHLNSAQNLQADVVFVTGVPLQRATRWATVLNSLSENRRPTARVRYFVGPQSNRHMRYRVYADAEELRNAGLAAIIQQPFEGGSYDVVLQISPLGGYCSDFEHPPDDASGSLARVEPRSGSSGPMYIIVGAEGSTNFPRDALHLEFKSTLEKKGFSTVHVEKSNYMNWETAMFETFPPKLVELILDDEWNKAVGRIPPFAANQLVRFRVNTIVNYDVVDRAYAAFEHDLRGNPDFTKATHWWTSVEKAVRKYISDGYVKRSRDADSKSNDSFGNVKISEKVKGMKFSWESMMSRISIRDILASTTITESSLPSQLVDDIMCHAVVAMTSKLLKIYAFNRYVTKREPEMQQLEPYLAGTKDTQPLDFRNFPQLHGDISSIQREVVGNPMYDPAGMLVGLVALSASNEQVEAIVGALQKQAPLLSAEKRVSAMKAAYAGEQPEQLVKRYFDKSDEPAKKVRNEGVTRVLVLTDAGDEADSETALWLLSSHMPEMKDVQIDVVFTTGNPSLRAMRWATVLNSLGKDAPGQQQMHYFAGPETTREMRYFIKLKEKELVQAGMADLSQAHFDGGSYSLVLQASPLEGFSEDFANPPAGPTGALGRLLAARLDGRLSPVYMIVGEEGSANCPTDTLHCNFKDFVVKQGFAPIHVTPRNYVRWSTSLFTFLPSTLVTLALQDEWKKAVGRIPPTATTLFLRFRVNSRVNYDAVNKAYCWFEQNRKASDSFKQAVEWWKGIADEVKKSVTANYVKASREHDERGGTSGGFGNPPIRETEKGHQATWRSVMSDACVMDILTATGMTEDSLLALSVDEVMSLAVTEITGKLLRIYAFSAFDSKVMPNKQQCIGYVAGSAANPPLDFYQFPRLFGDISSIQKEVVGNPMYHTSGVLLALAFLQSSAEQNQFLHAKLSARQPLLGESELDEVACGAFGGKSAGSVTAELCGDTDCLMSVKV